MLTTRSLPLILTVFLTGCAVTAQDCDPRDTSAGFGTKLGCSTRGVYGERIQEKERILLDEQKANKLFRDVYRALEEEKRAVGKQRRRAQGQASALNRSLSALVAELKEKAEGNRQIEEQIVKLEADLARNRQAPGASSASVMQRQHELQQLQEQVMALESDLGLR